MHQSFYGRLRGAFKDRHRGRYLATIFAETAKTDSSIPQFLFRYHDYTFPKSVTLVPEHTLPTLSNRRFADLAAIDDEGNLLGLVEIKAGDENTPGNIGQLEDYCKVCQKLNIPFTLLTQSYPSREEFTILDDMPSGKHLLVGKLGDWLRHTPGKNAETVILRRMLREYLQEEGLIMEPIYPLSAGIRHFLRRSFAPKYSSRDYILNRQMLTEYLPEFLRATISNLSILSEEIDLGLDKNRRPTLDLHLNPYVDPRKLNRFIEWDTIDYVPDSGRVGGDLCFAARTHAGDANMAYLYIAYGYFFTLTENDKMKTGLYTEIYGQNENSGEFQSYKYVSLGKQDKLSQREFCISTLKTLLRDTLNQWLRERRTNNRYLAKKYSKKYIHTMENALKSLSS